ncbi:MAG: hypothetical protein OXE92_00965 [Bacteroidetes bacterium]|nr:hypothetical protein [Bacteroidota bacterium]
MIPPVLSIFYAGLRRFHIPPFGIHKVFCYSIVLHDLGGSIGDSIMIFSKRKIFLLSPLFADSLCNYLTTRRVAIFAQIDSRGIWTSGRIGAIVAIGRLFLILNPELFQFGCKTTAVVTIAIIGRNETRNHGKSFATAGQCTKNQGHSLPLLV